MILTHETRKARKLHVCDYCGQAINKGDSYEYQSGVGGGEFYTVCFHPECFAEAAKEAVFGELNYDFRGESRPEPLPQK